MAYATALTRFPGKFTYYRLRRYDRLPDQRLTAERPTLLVPLGGTRASGPLSASEDGDSRSGSGTVSPLVVRAPPWVKGAPPVVIGWGCSSQGQTYLAGRGPLVPSARSGIQGLGTSCVFSHWWLESRPPRVTLGGFCDRPLGFTQTRAVPSLGLRVEVLLFGQQAVGPIPLCQRQSTQR